MGRERMSKTREVLKIYTQPLLILKLKNVCDKREKLKNKTLYITEMGQHLDSHPTSLCACFTGNKNIGQICIFVARSPL